MSLRTNWLGVGGHTDPELVVEIRNGRVSPSLWVTSLTRARLALLPNKR